MPTPSRRTTLPWRIAAAALLLAIGPAWGEEREATGMAVSVAPAERTCFHDWLVGSGSVVARHEAQVRAARDGFLVDQIMVGAGDTVAADQTLARLVAAGGASDTATVKAPIAGTVVQVGATVGAFAATGARDPLFRIVGSDGLEVRAELLASRLARAKPGMSARLHILGLGDREGTVATVGTAIDAATQFGTVTILVADPRLRTGAFARIEIDGGPDCGVTVPLSALLAGPEGSAVAVVRDGRVEMRPVTIGLIAGGNAELRSGLDPEETVIVRAGAFLRDGDRVRAVPEAMPAAGGQ